MVTWPYVAGFFDGEGCIAHVNPGKISWRVSITQTDVHALDLVTEFLNSNGIKTFRHNDSKPFTGKSGHMGRRPCFSIWMGGRTGVVNFLSAVLPYLIVKKIQAQDLLRFLKMYPDLRGPVTRLRKPERCKHGHMFDTKNTRISKEGDRECRACGAARERARKAKLRAVLQKEPAETKQE